MTSMNKKPIRFVLRFFRRGSWLLQGFGLLKCLPPLLALLYHLAEQMLFCLHFVPNTLGDASFMTKFAYLMFFQMSAAVTLGTAFQLKFRSRFHPTDLAVTARVCKKCGQPREARTYHCLLCNICVPLFDHHCAWLDVCIGKHNRRLFIHFLFVFGLRGVTMALLLYRNFWRLNIFEFSDLLVFGHFVTSLFFGSASLILGFVQLIFVALNQTTMEFLMNKPRDKQSLVKNFQLVFGRSWLGALVPLYDEVWSCKLPQAVSNIVDSQASSVFCDTEIEVPVQGFPDQATVYRISHARCGGTI